MKYNPVLLIYATQLSAVSYLGYKHESKITETETLNWTLAAGQWSYKVEMNVLDEIAKRWIERTRMVITKLLTT